MLYIATRAPETKVDRGDPPLSKSVSFPRGHLLETIVMDKNETIIRRWFSEVWNKGDVSTIDDLLEPSAVVDGLLPDRKHKGREEFKEFHKSLYSTFSDFDVTVDEVVSSGNHATGSWHGTVVHSGTFQGRAATGKRLEMRGTFEVTIVEGKIVNGSNRWNYDELLPQIDA
jgi:predicted ester cyclase